MTIIELNLIDIFSPTQQQQRGQEEQEEQEVE